MPKTFVNFDNYANHKNQAENAFNNVTTLLGKANAALIDIGNKQAERDRFVKWFGTYSVANKDQVYGVIHKMLIQLRDRQVTLQHGGPNCGRDDYAYVAAAGGGLGAGVIIYLCDMFFRAPLYGTNSQVGTILHETSHLVGETQDHAYGEQDCKNLARKNPINAILNADNYEFYIESFHYN